MIGELRLLIGKDTGTGVVQYRSGQFQVDASEAFCGFILDDEWKNLKFVYSEEQPERPKTDRLTPCLKFW